MQKTELSPPAIASRKAKVSALGKRYIGSFYATLRNINFGEQLARAALESLGYFLIHGFKVGVREADFLAIKREGNGFKFFHIEAQISWSPSGVLRAQTKYEDSAMNWRKAAKDYAQKFFSRRNYLRQ